MTLLRKRAANSEQGANAQIGVSDSDHETHGGAVFFLDASRESNAVSCFEAPDPQSLHLAATKVVLQTGGNESPIILSLTRAVCLFLFDVI